MKNNVVEPQSGDPNKPLTASIFERKLHSLNTPKERSDANSITEKKTTTSDITLFVEIPCQE